MSFCSTTSLRFRLALVLTIGFGLLILVTGVLLFRSVQDHAIREFDTNLVSRLMEMSGRIENERGEIGFDYKAHQNPEFERDALPSHFQIWFANGEELYRSTHLGDNLLGEGNIGASDPHDHVLPGGRCMRVTSCKFWSSDDGDADDEGGAKAKQKERAPDTSYEMVFAVARGRESIDGMLASIQQVAILAGVASAMLGLAFVFLTIRKGFQPLRRMEREVAKLTPSGLQQRVTADRMPDELAPIARQINSLVDRVETAMRRERSFTGNVAHELRTPVSELTSLAQVAGRWPDDEVAVRRFFGDVDDIGQRMQSVISNMLLLARCANGREPTIDGTCHLGQLLTTTWQRHRDQAVERKLHLTVEPHEHDIITTDCDKLALIVDNLLGNAICYATEGSYVHASIETREGETRLTIANDASRLSADALECISEPFWRLDEARSSTQHAGLGLSVVGALALRLGLTVEFSQTEPAQTINNRFQVTVRGFRASRTTPVSPSNTDSASPHFATESKTGNDS